MLQIIFDTITIIVSNIDTILLIYCHFNRAREGVWRLVVCDTDMAEEVDDVLQ